MKRSIQIAGFLFLFSSAVFADTCNWVPYSPQVVETSAACGDNTVRRATCVGTYYCTRTNGNPYYGMCALYRPATGCDRVSVAQCRADNGENLEIMAERDYQQLLQNRPASGGTHSAKSR